MFGGVLRALGVPMRDDQQGAAASGGDAQTGRLRRGGADAFSALPTSQALRDNQPMMDWIRQREADVRRR